MHDVGLDPAPVGERTCRPTDLVAAGAEASRECITVWRADDATVIAGANMLKHAPTLGAVVAACVSGGTIPPVLAARR